MPNTLLWVYMAQASEAAAAGGMPAGTLRESRDAIPKSRAAVLTAEFRFLATSCKLRPPQGFPSPFVLQPGTPNLIPGNSSGAHSGAELS